MACTIATSLRLEAAMVVLNHSEKRELHGLLKKWGYLHRSLTGKLPRHRAERSVGEWTNGHYREAALRRSPDS
jgi:hypothetical protein